MVLGVPTHVGQLLDFDSPSGYVLSWMLGAIKYSPQNYVARGRTWVLTESSDAAVFLIRGWLLVVPPTSSESLFLFPLLGYCGSPGKSPYSRNKCPSIRGCHCLSTQKLTEGMVQDLDGPASFSVPTSGANEEWCDSYWLLGESSSSCGVSNEVENEAASPPYRIGPSSSG